MKVSEAYGLHSGDTMRRSLTTLLTTLAVIASLLFMSQFPAISSVSSVDPRITEGEKPPSTDTDGDKIPDVHENLFESWMNWTAIDGRDIYMPGMDKEDASDAYLDNDRDGLNATEEYCWPYPANCTASGFPRGLTGSVDGAGERTYLDPRMSDTDGDGMPDGYEVYMCHRTGGFDIFTLRYVCPAFDPLNASDMTDDPDEDGFDVNRDGVLSVTERFTSPEEYMQGAPLNHTTELDGLWCSASLPEGSILVNWPFIPTGANATFQNILAACTTNATNVVDEDLWLGTDPLLDDSDRYHWDGFSIRRLFPSFGDGIPDGWEVHFGLDPLNRTNALIDADNDGWDANRDGGISPDVSRTLTAIKLGEALSTLEEYMVHEDDGNSVIAGLKSVSYGEEEGTARMIPLTFTASPDELSVLHYDIRDIETDGSNVYVSTRYGLTFADFEAQTSIDQWMPQGVEINDASLLKSGDDAYAIAVATSIGMAVAPLQADGSFAALSTWAWAMGDELNALAELDIEGQNQQLLALGDSGAGAIIEINSAGAIVQSYALSTSLTTALSESNASVTAIAHGAAGGGTKMLYVGTDRGLVMAETATVRDEFTPSWRFHYTTESTPIPTSIDELRSLSLGMVANPAEVRTLVLDGPNANNAQVLWFGTPSGLHRMSLLDSSITHSGLLEHPGIDGQYLRDLNNIHSIFPTGDELLIGSQRGLWAISGDYTAVYGLQGQEPVYGELSTLNWVSIDGNITILAGSAPGQYANLELMNPGANDSDNDGMPDGWEVANGLDPTDPYDALLDMDGDGLDLDQAADGFLERLWTNLDEFRYVETTPLGYNSTNPREGDTDGDGLGDGEEYFGFFYETSNLWCHYTVQLEYICDDAAGLAANTTYLGLSSTDVGTDPTNFDSDGDGMPDGWEITHRRWVGSSFTGGNNWSLDPNRADDANWDADQDGLANLCEYQWSLVKGAAMEGLLLESHGESAESAASWSTADPNNIDSDGDSLPDGWESNGACEWDPSRVGVNPLNGSDLFENPDGDGMLDGIEHLFTAWNLSAETWTLNPLVAGDGDFDGDEDGLIDAQEFALASSNPENGIEHPSDAPLLHIDGDAQQATEKAQRVFNILITKETRGKRLLTDFNGWQQGEPPNAIISILLGMTDPTNPDTDGDGMYDGFEYWFTAWNLDQNRWSMNPLIDNDVNLDTDGDSFDCNGDGVISQNETFSNLREWESRTWGKYLERSSVPAALGIIDFGEDAMNAYMEETGMSLVQAKDAIYDDFVEKSQDSADRMEKINEFNFDNFNRTLIGVADPTSDDSDGDGITDGWEYCYALYGMEDTTTINHWASNPINPWDVDYDGDQDGWYGRTAFDIPADQGTWSGRVFTPSTDVIQPGLGDLPFTNWMEWDNQTRPDLNDSDGDSVSYTTTVVNGAVTAHNRDFNLSDGREVFKYGINPSDNDTDGDMIPDWYEYAKAWNESNDNFSSFLRIRVVWIDAATGGACDTDTNSCLPLSQQGAGGALSRPDLTFTWFTLNPADPLDANFDPDQDGNWDCTGAGCAYEPYTNFQEFYTITNSDYASPNAVRLSGLIYDGEIVLEWWQFRAAMLGLDENGASTENYLKMDQSSSNDIRFAYIVDDKDTNFLVLDSGDDVVHLAGNWTDAWEIYYQASPYSSPVRSVGEHEFGWYLLDFDDDHIAEGTDPTNWDTDGDWMVDWFEVHDDEEDGVRGDSSPIRYDSRQTGS